MIQARYRTHHLRSAMLVALLSASACSGAQPAERHADEPPAADEINYEAGPWWRGRLDNVLLSFEHILIAHDEAIQQEAGFVVDVARTKRTKAEAFALARRVAEEARKSPASFGALAERYSDDRATAQGAGRVEVIAASILPGPTVDALGNLREGEVSSVIDTSLGYQVVRRLSVRADQRVSGSQILIMHDGIQALARAGREQAKSRSEEQARELAARIAREAQEHPERFEALEAKHSDGFQMAGGDMGEWSTHDPRADYQALGVMLALAPNHVSAPVFHPQLGFRIFKRTPNRPRAELADSRFLIAHVLDKQVAWADRRVTRTRDEAAARAKELAQELEQHPERFDALRKEHCEYGFCQLPQHPYAEGRSQLPGLEQALLQTPVGGLLSTPLEIPIGFVFARREDPKAMVEPEPSVAFELPRPPPRTLLSASNREIASFTRWFKDKAIEKLGLEGKDAERFATIVDELALAYETAPAAERKGLYDTTLKELQAALGSERAARVAQYSEKLQAEIAAR